MADDIHEFGYLETGYLQDPYLQAYTVGHGIGFQVNQNITSSSSVGFQVQQQIAALNSLGFQVQMIMNKESSVGLQVNMIDDQIHNIGMQVQRQFPNQTKAIGFQVNRQIQNYLNSVGFQVQQNKTAMIGFQVLLSIYNNSQLRILKTFPSRGTTALGGTNWTASSTASGFSVNNLNTDIVEQVYKSGSTTSVTLKCDTGLTQGVPIDTIAILNHNLTTSATVQVQGSNDSTFSSIAVSYNMTPELIDMYYVAATLPNSDHQVRYWRFVIEDSTNTDGFIKIGTILFGQAEIFTIAESFSNPVVRGYIHFKDAAKNEGFTTVSNNRALKKFVKLRFEKLNYYKGNYQILDNMMKFSRTSLKVLVIPTPTEPSKFAVFGKIQRLPDITHQSVGDRDEYVDLELEWDESL